MRDLAKCPGSVAWHAVRSAFANRVMLCVDERRSDHDYDHATIEDADQHTGDGTGAVELPKYANHDDRGLIRQYVVLT